MTERALMVIVLMALPVLCRAAPVQLTSGVGDDTEAAWSPDGSQIAFQRKSNGDVDLCVLDVESGEVITVVGGPGHALHPCWSPDGDTIVYAFAHFTHTAAEGIENGYNLFAVPAQGGEPQRLTSGMVRDYTPTFTPGGDAILFSTTRGLETSGANLMRIPAEGGEPEALPLQEGRDTGFVEPAFSPDGSLICCSHIRSFRDNWALRLLRSDDLASQFALTFSEASMYAPDWSPDGGMVACTGYRAGDAGWGIYVVEVESGLSVRLDTGPGNCRSPVWSPDGERLVFESNRDGAYRLYSMDVPELEFGTVPALPDDAAVLSLEFDAEQNAVRDISSRENRVRLAGDPTVQESGVAFEPGQFLTAEEPEGMSFGDGPFCVHTELTVEEHTGEVQIIAVGDYAQHRQGWQLFISDEGYLFFNSRDVEGAFISGRSDVPLEPDRRVSVAGIRRDSGRVELWVDGVRQQYTRTGADMNYADVTQVRIGSQYSGGMDFVGTIHNLTIFDQAPAPETLRAPHLKEFVTQ